MFLAFYAKDAVREPRCLGPLLPTVINKDVQLDTHQVRRPVALRRNDKKQKKERERNQAQMCHCYSCKESQDPVHKRLN